MLRGGALVGLVALSSVRGLEPGPPSKRCGIAVESAAEMTPEKWHGTYHRRQPVLLTSTANGGMGSWAAMDKWTPEWLLENMGDHQLKIVDPQLLEQRGGFAPSVGSVRLGSFVKMLQDEESGSKEDAAPSGHLLPLAALLDERLRWIEARIASGERPSPSQLVSFIAMMNRDILTLSPPEEEAAAEATADLGKQLKRSLRAMGWNVKKNRPAKGRLPTLNSTVAALRSSVTSELAVRRPRTALSCFSAPQTNGSPMCSLERRRLRPIPTTWLTPPM